MGCLIQPASTRLSILTRVRGPILWSAISPALGKIDTLRGQRHLAAAFAIDPRTTDPGDDVQVLRGQAWITVTSASKGRATSPYWRTSPGPPPDGNARIHWVDAQWCFPAPSIASAGGRQTHSRPPSPGSPTSRRGAVGLAEVCDGPPAGLRPTVPERSRSPPILRAGPARNSSSSRPKREPTGLRSRLCARPAWAVQTNGSWSGRHAFCRRGPRPT